MSRPGPAALALLARPAWRDVRVGALIQWGIFVPLLSVLLGIAALPQNPGFALLTALLSPIYSAPVGAVVTVVLGVPLAKLLAWVLRSSTAWVAHLVAFLGLGFVVSVLLLHLWMLLAGSLWDSAAWWASMPIILPIVFAATLSVGAGWGIAWRRAVLRERALPLLVESYA